MIKGDAIIHWKGFSAMVCTLEDQGWQLSSKSVFGRKAGFLQCIGNHVYLRHPEHFMLGRFFVPLNSQATDYELDFMVNAKQHQARLVKSRGDYQFGSEDIQGLLTAILEAQQSYPKQANRRSAEPIGNRFQFGNSSKIKLFKQQA